MARSIPSDLTRLALAGAHGPEIATPAQPRDALPEDYTAFHGVHWTRQYRGHTLYGEFDFAVLNRAVRIPDETGHRFHVKVDTDSTANWTPIPGESGH